MISVDEQYDLDPSQRRKTRASHLWPSCDKNPQATFLDVLHYQFRRIISLRILYFYSKENSTISNSLIPLGVETETTSPSSLPIMALAMGEFTDIFPAFASASSTPTI